MQYRRFFLAFALAMLSSMGLLLFLDTREVNWEAYRPRSARLDAAYPLGGSQWLLQLTVRSALSMAYSRSVVYDFEQRRGYTLGAFEDQWYPMGFSDGTLWLLREQSYITSLRESQILSRLNAPSEVSTSLEIWRDGQVEMERRFLVRENGLPFVCGGRLASTSYGNSDTAFYTIDRHDAMVEWFVVPEASPNLPFCAADGRVYVAIDDTAYYTLEADGDPAKRRGKLQGQFALNGLWVGAPQDGDCVYKAPDPRDLSSADLSTDATTLLIRGSSCAERMAVLGGVRALSPTPNDTDVYIADQPPQRFAGRLAGVGASGFVLEKGGQAVVWLHPGDVTGWSAIEVSHGTLFEAFPPVPIRAEGP